jgi:hypothetical protein
MDPIPILGGHGVKIDWHSFNQSSPRVFLPVEVGMNLIVTVQPVVAVTIAPGIQVVRCASTAKEFSWLLKSWKVDGEIENTPKMDR